MTSSRSSRPIARGDNAAGTAPIENRQLWSVALRSVDEACDITGSLFRFTRGEFMRIAAGCVIAFVISVALQGQPPFPRPQFRCEVQNFTGAMSPGGAVARMTIVSDGLACPLPRLWCS